jgi:hypothetical protein
VRPFSHGNAWSSSLIWGRNHDTFTQRNLNSYLAETVYPITRRDFITGRIEIVDKDELFADDPALEQEIARTVGSTFRIRAFTAGYTRDLWAAHKLETGLGANITAYAIPSAITPYYGSHPFGINIYLRVRLKPG